MENEDCYYFLYSTCKRGSSCIYRHNLNSKLNTTLCDEWDKTKKCRLECPFRHSYYHLKKNRSEDYCYWEGREEGCTKRFCEFKHKDMSKDVWKEGGIKTLEQIKKDKNQRKSFVEDDTKIDFESFEKERLEKRIEKIKKLKSLESEKTNICDEETEKIIKILNEVIKSNDKVNKIDNKDIINQNEIKDIINQNEIKDIIHENQNTDIIHENQNTDKVNKNQNTDKVNKNNINDDKLSNLDKELKDLDFLMNDFEEF